MQNKTLAIDFPFNEMLNMKKIVYVIYIGVKRDIFSIKTEISCIFSWLGGQLYTGSHVFHFCGSFLSYKGEK